MSSENVRNLSWAGFAISRLCSKSFMEPSSGEARRSAFGAQAAAGSVVTELVVA